MKGAVDPYKFPHMGYQDNIGDYQQQHEHKVEKWKLNHVSPS